MDEKNCAARVLYPPIGQLCHRTQHLNISEGFSYCMLELRKLGLLGANAAVRSMVRSMLLHHATKSCLIPARWPKNMITKCRVLCSNGLNISSRSAPIFLCDPQQRRCKMPAWSAECNTRMTNRLEELNQAGLPTFFGLLARLSSPKSDYGATDDHRMPKRPARSAASLTWPFKKQKI